MKCVMKLIEAVGCRREGRVHGEEVAARSNSRSVRALLQLAVALLELPCLPDHTQHLAHYSNIFGRLRPFAYLIYQHRSLF